MTRVALIEGPIARTLFELAWPVLVVLALQTFVGVAETYFVSFLGTTAIAGVTLVFPLFMLMTMMSNGGIGGGVTSAVARALGAGRATDAQALVLHAVVIAVAFGAVFTIGAWAGGPALFQYMGARDETLINAHLYSNVLFAAAVPGWIANLLGSALRGAGNVRVPATKDKRSSEATAWHIRLLIPYSAGSTYIRSTTRRCNHLSRTASPPASRRHPPRRESLHQISDRTGALNPARRGAQSDLLG